MIATLLRLAGINANVEYEICSWQSGQKNSSWIAPGGGVSIYIYIPSSKLLNKLRKKQFIRDSKEQKHQTETFLRPVPGFLLTHPIVTRDVCPPRRALLQACALVMSFEVPELLAFAKSTAREWRPKLLLCLAKPIFFCGQDSRTGVGLLESQQTKMENCWKITTFNRR